MRYPNFVNPNFEFIAIRIPMDRERQIFKSMNKKSNAFHSMAYFHEGCFSSDLFNENDLILSLHLAARKKNCLFSEFAKVYCDVEQFNIIHRK